MVLDGGAIGVVASVCSSGGGDCSASADAIELCLCLNQLADRIHAWPVIVGVYDVVGGPVGHLIQGSGSGAVVHNGLDLSGVVAGGWEGVVACQGLCSSICFKGKRGLGWGWAGLCGRTGRRAGSQRQATLFECQGISNQ